MMFIRLVFLDVNPFILFRNIDTYLLRFDWDFSGLSGGWFGVRGIDASSYSDLFDGSGDNTSWFDK